MEKRERQKFYLLGQFCNWALPGLRQEVKLYNFHFMVYTLGDPVRISCLSFPVATGRENQENSKKTGGCFEKPLFGHFWGSAGWWMGSGSRTGQKALVAVVL